MVFAIGNGRALAYSGCRKWSIANTKFQVPGIQKSKFKIQVTLQDHAGSRRGSPNNLPERCLGPPERLSAKHREAVPGAAGENLPEGLSESMSGSSSGASLGLPDSSSGNLSQVGFGASRGAFRTARQAASLRVSSGSASDSLSEHLPRSRGKLTGQAAELQTASPAPSLMLLRPPPGQLATQPLGQAFWRVSPAAPRTASRSTSRRSVRPGRAASVAGSVILEGHLNFEF